MKKRFPAALFLLSLLCSCAAPAAESPAPSLTAETGTPIPTETPAAEGTTADAIARAIVASQPNAEGYMARPEEDMDFYLSLYGLEGWNLPDMAVYAAEGVDGREVAVLRLESMNNELTRVTEALEGYRQNRAADFFGYAPQQAALIENGTAAGGWGCAVLLLCEDMEAAQAAFEVAAGASGEEGEVLPGFSPAETRWFVTFDPPNELDMTPYDTAPILAAWETGDREKLSEKDAAILSGAEEALANVPEGVSDYVKELLLHDWLLDRCTYDRTAHDPHTPEGMEGSRDPYGPLVEGRGICLGYATTFQLLMDMAGVECITVVGASKESRQDHAWNMVRLAGEWYCVDSTWNDSDDSRREETRHTYFNCTSDFMRNTNHQWDYQNTPKATAADYGERAIRPEERLGQ